MGPNHSRQAFKMPFRERFELIRSRKGIQRPYPGTDFYLMPYFLRILRMGFSIEASQSE